MIAFVLPGKSESLLVGKSSVQALARQVEVIESVGETLERSLWHSNLPAIPKRVFRLRSVIGFSKKLESVDFGPKITAKNRGTSMLFYCL